MVELVEFIAKSLCEDKDQVKVTSKRNKNSLDIVLHVSEDDMGRIIGKQGRIAKSIRSILKAMSLKENLRVNLQIEQ